MNDEKETVRKLSDSAKKEFMEKGFMKASLRNICKNAGVTTGALYFFFKDKDALFVSLIQEPLKRVYEIMISHYEQEKQEEDNLPLIQDNSDDYRASYEIIHEMYTNRDEFILLLTKSQGSSVEHAIDELIKVSDKHYRIIADIFSKKAATAPVDKYFIHWLSHMQIDVFIYMITHIETEAEAMDYMKHVVGYMLSGWYGMFGNTNKNILQKEGEK